MIYCPNSFPYQSKHTFVNPKINPRVVTQIESVSDPSSIYHKQMRNLQIEELQQSFQDLRRKKQRSDNKQHYLKRIDEVLGELQRNRQYPRVSGTNSHVLPQYTDYQELKDSRVRNHVELNYDSDVFNHENDRYQEYQKKSHGKALEIVRMQQHNKLQNMEQKHKDKIIEYHERIERAEILAKDQQLQREARKKMMMNYQQQLGEMVREKNQRNRMVSMRSEPVHSHHPINNPIEYRIHNPYILKRLQHQFI